jgi:DNA-3-methyladenine glycosylase
MINGQRVSGIIVETEAYKGPKDVASHARHGAESKAAPMFGEPGHAYVYFTYGMHYCMNCVSEPVGSGTGVLIRALEPEEGIGVMARRRGPGITEHNLTNGPAKLCQALSIDKKLNTADLLGDTIWVEAGEPVPKSRIKRTARVGIARGREHQWRFYDSASSFVSAHPKY